MLTRQHRQEALSRAYVHAVAARAGLNYSTLAYDYGIDVSLRNIVAVGNQLRDGGVQLDLQLRATTRAGVSEAVVSYDLDVRTHDLLRGDGVMCPRILVVLVLPDDEDD